MYIPSNVVILLFFCNHTTAWCRVVWHSQRTGMCGLLSSMSRQSINLSLSKALVVLLAWTPWRAITKRGHQQRMMGAVDVCRPRWRDIFICAILILLGHSKTKSHGESIDVQQCRVIFVTSTGDVAALRVLRRNWYTLGSVLARSWVLLNHSLTAARQWWRYVVCKCLWWRHICCDVCSHSYKRSTRLPLDGLYVIVGGWKTYPRVLLALTGWCIDFHDKFQCIFIDTQSYVYNDNYGLR